MDECKEEDRKCKRSKHFYSTVMLLVIIAISILTVLATGIEGRGTVNYLTKFLGNDLIGNSSIYDDGENVTVARLKINNVYHVYGKIDPTSQTIDIATANNWTKVTNSTGNLWTGSEFDGFNLTNDSMTVLNGGDYAGIVSISLSGLNGKDFAIRLYNLNNGHSEGAQMVATTTGTTNYIDIALPVYMEDANISDVFEIQIACLTDGSDPIIRSASFYISYLHD